MAVGARDLCVLADVVRYAPGYDADSDENSGNLNDVLQALITAESTKQLRRGREFRAIAGAGTRSFDIGHPQVRTRQLRIGDCATITTVTIVNELGATVETVAATDRVSLPRIRQEWEPIRKLWFLPGSSVPATLGCGYTVQIVGTWGFPSVPADVVQAVAKLVVVRYVDEVAREGTAFTEALRGVDLGLLQQTAVEDLDSYFVAGLA